MWPGPLLLIANTIMPEVAKKDKSQYNGYIKNKASRGLATNRGLTKLCGRDAIGSPTF